MEKQPMLGEIPPHLSRYITRQDPSLYTPIDQACWRYILKLSQAFFEKHAHPKYLDGLMETGISLERIPLIEEIDLCLRRFNWKAVSVSGFIPPAAFMEFLSLGILPIACDMRSLEHIAYTPAPDIVHEAAGHAPIIADPEYAAYLRSYGEISKKAISSIEDLKVYEAIRNLSEVKEDPRSTQETIEQAQKTLDLAISSVTYTSEATLLSRMGWWTFEYGLSGTLSEPKIFGAGLLSSLSESFHCLAPEVKKIPFSIDCTEVNYDITQPQPQLFVAPDFHILKQALIDLGNRMAFRKGGLEGLQKALRCRTVTTTTLDSGIAISGILKQIYKNKAGEPIYLTFDGPTQLSYHDQEIPGHGTQYHNTGFGTPLEKIREEELQKWRLKSGAWSQLKLPSGIAIEGNFVGSRKIKGQLVILSFQNCTVSLEGTILFQPDWGTYDMVCGTKVISVSGGPADQQKFIETQSFSHSNTHSQKTNLTENNKSLAKLYQTVRTIRESAALTPADLTRLKSIYLELNQNYPGDWLLRFELLELLALNQIKADWEQALRTELQEIGDLSAEKAELIKRGLDLLKGSH
jgi:phenylalanine-4-hydroxylase